MKLNTLDMLRVWAGVTGMLIAALYFIQIALGLQPSAHLLLMAGGIAGFELFLFAQDLWIYRGGRNG